MKNRIEFKRNFVYNVDCKEGLKQLPSKSIDSAFIDPPYNFVKDFGVYKDNLPENEYKEMIEDVLNELRRITKKGFAVYIKDNLFEIYKKMIPESINIALPNNHFILTTEKQAKSKNKDLWSNVDTSIEYKKGFDHPAKMPLAIIKKFLEDFSQEGDLILDCFAGAGSTGIACKELNRNFIGFEINPEYCRLANKYLLRKNIKE